jgi:hypothetical protein
MHTVNSTIVLVNLLIYMLLEYCFGGGICAVNLAKEHPACD